MDSFVLPTGGGNLQGVEEQIVSRNFNLDELINVLKNILDLRVASVPEIFRAYTFPATDKTICIDQSVVPTLPWISCTIANDGPGSVFIFINEKKDIRDHDSVFTQRSNTTELIMGEEKEYCGKHSVIDRIYLQCSPGYTTNVRIFASGKRPVNQEVGVNEL